MKIYIAGKITGLPYERAKRKFDMAEKALADIGHTPINPILMAGWNLDHRRYMSIARNILCDDSTDAIFMLDDWADSPGAREELRIARRIGLPIYYMQDIPKGDANEQTAM